MFFYYLFVLAFTTGTPYAHFVPSNQVSNNIANNRRELIEIIRSLNELNEEMKINNKEYKNKVAIGDKEELDDVEKEKRLQEVLWLLKKNFKMQNYQNMANSPSYSGARLYFIRNPDALEEYKKYLKQKRKYASEEDNTVKYRKRNVRDRLKKMRRKVIFRVNEDTKEQSDIDKNAEKRDSNPEDKGNLNEDNQKLRLYSVEETKAYENSESKKVRDNRDYEEKRPIDSLELHNRVVHKAGQMTSNNERDKNKWNDRYDTDVELEPKWDTKRADNYKPERNAESSKGKFKNSWEVTTRFKNNYNWDKPTETTRGYKRKRVNYNEAKGKAKISYRNPKSESKFRDDFSLYGRTSIPYVGKKGIFEDD